MPKFRYSLDSGVSWVVVNDDLPFSIPSTNPDEVIVEPIGEAVTLPPVLPPPSGPVVSSASVTPSRINVAGQDYDVYRFTSNGSITFSSGGEVEYLIVGGGGAGGRSAFGASMGGGGGGGVLQGTITVSAATLPIVVGAGGAVAPANSFTTPAGNGGNSSFNGLEAIGGGGAGALDAANGRNGGSGGGGSRAGTAGNGTSGQGFAGGVALAGDQVNTSGGGGGAGGAGGNGKTDAQQPTFQLRGGDGGPGVSSSITGTAVTYGGGGGGGRGGVGGAGGGGAGGGAPGDLPAASGAPNTGGGGGGSYFGASPDVPGGAGGSGIVIVRVPV